MSTQHLFLALHAKHEQRTRHSVFRQGRYDATPYSCNVCLYLDAHKREMDRAEQQYYAQSAEAPATPAPQGAEGEG